MDSTNEQKRDDEIAVVNPIEKPTSSSRESDIEAANDRSSLPEAVVYCESSLDATADNKTLPIINIVNMVSTERNHVESLAIVPIAATVMFGVEGKDLNVPEAMATPTSNRHLSADGVLQSLGQQRRKQQSLPWRAEFVSATICKRKGRKIGLQLVADSASDSTSSFSENDTVLRIAKFEPDGLLHRSPLRVGDLLVSINEEPCGNKTLEQVEELLSKSDEEEMITIICENKHGQANLVESMMEKRKPNETIGLTLKRHHGTLKIQGVTPNSLCSLSLLNVGDRVIAINGADCHSLDGASAAEIINSSPRYVTLLTETQRTSGVVVAASNSFLQEIPILSSSYVAPRRANEIVAARQRFCLFVSLMGLLLIASFVVIAIS